MQPSPRSSLHCLNQIRPAQLNLACALLLSISATVMLAKKPANGTKVVSHVYNGYSRTVMLDGSYQPETYIFADGGFFNGEPIAGDKIQKLTFADVAKTVAVALRRQNYLPTTETDNANQLIVLWYGTLKSTKWEENPLAKDQKYRILGVQKERSTADDLFFTSIAADFHDEFDSNRYFVVLKAFDFQFATKEQQLKVLWESRFSIRRQATDFAASLPAMAEFASRTFGRETNGVYRPEALDSTVEIGDLEVVETETP